MPEGSEWIKMEKAASMTTDCDGASPTIKAPSAAASVAASGRTNSPIAMRSRVDVLRSQKRGATVRRAGSRTFGRVCVRRGRTVQ